MPSIRYTVVHATKRMTKTVSLDANGRMEKIAAVSPSSGFYREGVLAGERPADLLQQLAADLSGLHSREAVMMAPLPSPEASRGMPWRLCVQEVERRTHHGLARTNANFPAASGLALGFFDFDLPENVRADFPNARALLTKLLIPAWRGFERAALLIRPSVSSGVRLVGQTAPTASGYHVFCLIDDGLEIEAVAKALFDRIAAMGHAVVLASVRGSRLPRALLDKGASQPSRLVFEADAIIVDDGIERVERENFIHGGEILAAETILADLEAMRERDAARLEDIWRAAQAAAEPACRAAKVKYFKGRVREVVVAQKVSVTKARRAVRREMASYEAGILWDDDLIHLVDFGWRSVSEILSDPKTYHRAKGYSLDEETERAGVSFVCAHFSHAIPEDGRPEGPWLHSFEHGGRYWMLRSARSNPAAAISAAIVRLVDQLADAIMEVAA